MGAKQIIFKVLVYFLFFFIGVEYVLVLPSLNGYLESLQIGSNFVGICIAAVNFAALITATPLGRLSDHLGSARIVGSAAACFCCVGNVMYLMIPSIYVIVLSRVFSGVGSALEPILFGLLGRSYSAEERSAVFSRHMLAREMGLIFGPLLNLAFDEVDVVLYCSSTCPAAEPVTKFFQKAADSVCLSDDSCQPFMIRLNKYTMPAAFLAIAWFLLIVCLFIFYDEPTPVAIHQTESTNADLTKGFELENRIVKHGGDESKVLISKSNMPHRSTVTDSVRSAFDFDNPFLNITRSNYSLRETSVSMSGKSPTKLENGDVPVPASPLIEDNEVFDEKAEPRSAMQLVIKETQRKYPYLTEQFVVVMMSSFAVMFFESAMEASLTPMTAYFFHWENYENSICYVFLGLCALAGYIVIMLLQKFVQLEDRTALLAGGIGVSMGQTLGFFALPKGYYGAPWILPIFALTVAISVFSLPFLLVPPASLLSKIAPPDKQSTLQGVRMSFQKVAMVLGPLWGTSTLWNFYVVISAPVFMCSLVTIMTACSFYYLRDDRLVPPKSKC